MPQLLQSALTLEHVLNTTPAFSKHSIGELSCEKRVIVVFLRHFGCTFCRETLSDLGTLFQKHSPENITLILVHMADNLEAETYLRRYHLENAYRISDPERTLYKLFDLPEASFKSVFNVRTLGRFINAAFIRRHFFGPVVGDLLQMPGVILLENKSIVASHHYNTVSDRPNWVGLCQM
jgi:peroxiredoxin